MTFQPVAPFGGLAGWSFLQKTRAAQQDAFLSSPAISRATGDFASRIGNIRSSQDLVSDWRLLSVALGAFGLEADIGNRFFIRKVLEEGTAAPGSLANRLADKRYLALSAAFGFGDAPGGKTAEPGFAEGILQRYRERRFEAAVGDSSPDMRLALGLGRDLGDLAQRRLSNDGKWYTVMATPPLREVFERALGLPQSVGALDVDRQLDLFKTRAERRLGTSDIGRLAGQDGLASLTRRFLASSELAATPPISARGSAALALLSATPIGRL